MKSSPPRHAVARVLSRLGQLIPGVVLAGVLALAGEHLAQWLGTAVLGFTPSPIVAVPVAVLLGLVVLFRRRGWL